MRPPHPFLASYTGDSRGFECVVFEETDDGGERAPPLPVLTGSMSERTTEDPMTRSSAAPLHVRVRMAQERAMERGILRYVADKVWREAAPRPACGRTCTSSGGRSSAPKRAMRRSSSGTASPPPPPPPAPLALWPGALGDGLIAGFWNGDFGGARSKACRPRRSRRHGPGASLCARLGGSGFWDPMGPETLISIHVGVLSDFYCAPVAAAAQSVRLAGGGSRSGGPLRRLPADF
ncbi:hypothetical protein CSUB01_04963 [Colletotrichum sublineola]|uniref:Uncharacterized protein n=1 Tax=Colletotrichum sublineola TaxID=1173701 RepID=A0A066WUQ9_COLSU|nr:hypothetical protein CSUB01_04963 [Colletotrichum sublineola]